MNQIRLILHLPSEFMGTQGQEPDRGLSDDLRCPAGGLRNGDARQRRECDFPLGDS